MGSKKIHIFLVQPTAQADNRSATTPDAARLIRGTLAAVEAKLRAEASIEPCTAEQAHAMADVEIEEAGE